MQPLLAVSAQPSDCLTSNHAEAAGTAGMGKLLLQRMGEDVLCLEKRVLGRNI